MKSQKQKLLFKHYTPPFWIACGLTVIITLALISLVVWLFLTQSLLQFYTWIEIIASCIGIVAAPLTIFSIVSNWIEHEHKASPPQVTSVSDAGSLPITSHFLETQQTSLKGATSQQETQLRWNIPYHRNPLFTGRETLLQSLHDHFLQFKIAALTQAQAITGLGGIGKTQIAIEYAYRYQNEYQHVLWVNASSYETLVDGFVAIAHLEELQIKNEEDQNLIVEAVKQWFINHDRWLLILDNADDLSLINTFMPTSTTGSIIVTTRESATGNIIGFEVEGMDTTQSILFLLRRAKIIQITDDSFAQISEANMRNALEIVEAMDGLPLVLDQAGAYIEETQCSLSTYLKAFHRRRDEFLTRRGSSGKEHPAAVATTWSLNFEQVEKQNLMAAELLRFFAFLAPDAIPEELVIEGINQLGQYVQPLAKDESLLDDTLGVLRRFSLVRRNADKRLIVIHRLVQAVLQRSMTNEVRRLWAQRTIRAVNRAFPEVSVKTWSQCERYLSQALICAALVNEYNFAFPEAARLLDQAASYLRTRAQYKQAEPLFKQALAMREQVLGREQLDTARSINNLAELYRNQGRYWEAEPLFKQALTLEEHIVGSHHPDTAISLNGLANLYSSQGRFEEAKELFKQALEIRKELLGVEHSDTISTMSDLAELFDNQGSYQEAEQLHKQVFAIREHVLGPEHPDTAISLNNLATFYHFQGKYQESEQLFRQAIAVDENFYGSDHPDVATDINNLADLYRNQGRYEEAEPLFKKALMIRERMLGQDHPYTATSLNSLALLYQDQGKFQEAEILFKRSAAIAIKVYGPNHIIIASDLNDLAFLYQLQGKYVDVESLYKQALAIYERLMGSKHPGITATLSNLASFYQSQKRYEEAELFYKQALAIKEERLGSKHPDTASSMSALADLYVLLERFEDASGLYQRALTIYEQIFGKEDTKTRTVQSKYQNVSTKIRK